MVGDASMETFAPDTTYRHLKIQIATERPFEFIDVTPDVEALIAQAGIHVGFVNVQSLHTTTSIVVNEHEPQLLTDFALRCSVPSCSKQSEGGTKMRLKFLSLLALVIALGGWKVTTTLQAQAR